MIPTPIHRDDKLIVTRRAPDALTTAAAIARTLLEARAQLAYEIFAYRSGGKSPWEHCSQTTRDAFIRMVQWLDSAEPTCSQCHEPIWCHKCAGDS